VGNFDELMPYFPLWEAAGSSVAEGILGVIEVEQDHLSREVARIKKGTDGRALR